MRPLRCEVLVVGAGPAGGELARILARAGVDVLLVDQLPDLERAAFSSAAMPMAAVEGFGLPASVVASRWNGWQLIGPAGRARSWSTPAPLGVVLAFGALRRWLAEECRQWGGRVRLGMQALSCREGRRRLHTCLRGLGGEMVEVESAWVVDATGQGRALIGEPPGRKRHDLVSGVGVEWLLRVSPRLWESWAHRLSFCLGSDWIPQGYGWVFPMDRPHLKVGVCRLREEGSPQPPLGALQRALMARLLPSLESGEGEVLDRHGGLIRSTIRRREPHRRGRLLALGDAVSTANLLGGEGIRHAFTSSRVLAPLLLESLGRERGGKAGAEAPLQDYSRRLRRALGWRWSLSGRLARRTWLGLRNPRADHRLEMLLAGLDGLGAEDLSALLFDYRFERYGLRALPYLLGWR